jgi:hypothetical protein
MTDDDAFPESCEQLPHPIRPTDRMQRVNKTISRFLSHENEMTFFTFLKITKEFRYTFHGLWVPFFSALYVRVVSSTVMKQNKTIMSLNLLIKLL